MNRTNHKDKPFIACDIKLADQRREAIAQVLDQAQSKAERYLLSADEVLPLGEFLTEQVREKTLLPKTKQPGIRVRYSEALALKHTSSFTAEMTELTFEYRTAGWFLIGVQRKRIGEKKAAHVDVSVPKHLEQECLTRFKAGFEVREQEAQSAGPGRAPALSLQEEFEAWVRGQAPQSDSQTTEQATA